MYFTLCIFYKAYHTLINSIIVCWKEKHIEKSKKAEWPWNRNAGKGIGIVSETPLN